MRLRMKGGPYRLRWRGKELSLILIVLVCATILIWTWDRSPVLTSSLPSKDQLLQLSPEHKGHVREDISTSIQREVINNEEEHHVDKIPSSDTSESSSEFDIVPIQKKEHKRHVGEDISTSIQKEVINHEEEHYVDKIPSADNSKSSSEFDVVPIQKKEHKRHAREDTSTLIQREVINHEEEHHLNKIPSTDTSESSSEFDIVPIQKKEDETEIINHSPKREKTGVVKGGSSSKQIEETKNVILGEKTSEQEEKRVENQACNYAKGKWVIDDRRPLYSGFGCKQWLASMWACRLMQRQDFAFEKLRWQPKECEIEEFKGSKFLKRMQDKTLAFVGDSLGRQQFQSLMCMITAGKDISDVQDVGKEYGLVIPPGGKRPNGWAYRFPSTNTTVLYYWSASLCDLEPLNVNDPHTEYAMHLDRPPAFLRQYLHKIDVLVLNTGHHWNRGKLRGNRWVMYVGGVPNTNRKIADMGGAKNFTIHSIVKWVNSQLRKHPHLKAFYRSISPRHFVNGDWNTGGSCDNTSPMSIGKEVLQEESSDYSAASAVRGTGVKLLDITALSQVRDEGHISRFSITASPGVQDCLHWCLPGVPDTWNEILFAQI